MSWLGRRLFGLIHRTSLIYNQCWEDPALDRQALSLSEKDRVLVITSAGCNALDYALLGAKVLAVDSNPRQNHLLELKLAGIRALDFDSFFALFGKGGDAHTQAIYQSMRVELPVRAKQFWDKEIRLFDPMRLAGRSFYYGGTSGLVALTIRAYIDHVARAREVVEQLLSATTIEEQVEVYKKDLRERLLRAARVVGSPAVLSLLGVPAPQREMVVGHCDGFRGFIGDCLDHVMSVALLRDNYFWWVYATGSYSRESCPEYLKPANFEKLKQGLVHNVRTATGTVTECLRRETEPFTAFALLDHMDWLVGQPELLKEEWDEIFARAASSARVIFRSGGRDAAFIPASVSKRLSFEREKAAALHRQDRVGTYGSFHIGRLIEAA